MHTFKDIAGTEWTVSLSISAMERIRDMAGVDMLLVNQGRFTDVVRIGGDLVLFRNVLHAACHPQAMERGVGLVAFGDLLAGESIGAAHQAFLGAIHSFIQDPWIRTALTRVLEKHAELRDQVKATMEKAVDEALAEMQSGATSLSAQAPSASTPAP